MRNPSVFCRKKGLSFGVFGFCKLFREEFAVLAQGDGVYLSTRIYFNSHGFGSIMKGHLKVCIECYLTIWSTLSKELTFSMIVWCDCIDRNDLNRVLKVPVWSGTTIRLARLLGQWVIWGTVGRGTGSAMVAVPVRRVAGSVLSMRPANTASSGLVLDTSSWSLFARWFGPSLLAQGCKVVATTAGVALLTLGWALGVRIGITTLLTAVMVWQGQGIHMYGWGGCSGNGG